MLNEYSCLGLVLTWLRSRGPLRLLSFMFGLVPSTTNVWLRFGKRILVRVLMDNKYAKVEMPTTDEIYKFAMMIESKHPDLKFVWGAIDGMHVDLQIRGDHDLQRLYYNKWKSRHYITNLFLFSPDGKIR